MRDIRVEIEVCEGPLPILCALDVWKRALMLTLGNIADNTTRPYNK